MYSEDCGHMPCSVVVLCEWVMNNFCWRKLMELQEGICKKPVCFRGFVCVYVFLWCYTEAS